MLHVRRCSDVEQMIWCPSRRTAHAELVEACSWLLHSTRLPLDTLACGSRDGDLPANDLPSHLIRSRVLSAAAAPAVAAALSPTAQVDLDQPIVECSAPTGRAMYASVGPLPGTVPPGMIPGMIPGDTWYFLGQR